MYYPNNKIQWMLWSLFCILIYTHCTIYIVLRHTDINVNSGRLYKCVIKMGVSNMTFKSFMDEDLFLPVTQTRRMKFHPFPRRSGTTRSRRWRVPGPRVKVDWLEPRGCCAFPKGCSPGLVDGATASAPRPGRGNRLLWTGCCALWPVRWMSTTGGRPLGESAAGFKR